jgi:hypothetical protein
VNGLRNYIRAAFAKNKTPGLFDRVFTCKGLNFPPPEKQASPFNPVNEI